MVKSAGRKEADGSVAAALPRLYGARLDRGLGEPYPIGPNMELVLDQPVLVLNRLWQAVNVICAKRAFALLARGHAAVIHHYRDDFRVFSFLDWMDFSRVNPPVEAIDTVHTPRTTIRLPRVILLTFLTGCRPRS